MEVIWIIIGIIIGLAISIAGFFFRSIGALRIDKSDPTDKPYMFLEIKRGIGDITRRKFVVLRVKREDFIPHE
jgi:hypothetical protein